MTGLDVPAGLVIVALVVLVLLVDGWAYVERCWWHRDTP